MEHAIRFLPRPQYRISAKAEGETQIESAPKPELLSDPECFQTSSSTQRQQVPWMWVIVVLRETLTSPSLCFPDAVLRIRKPRSVLDVMLTG